MANFFGLGDPFGGSSSQGGGNQQFFPDLFKRINQFTPQQQAAGKPAQPNQNPWGNTTATGPMPAVGTSQSVGIPPADPMMSFFMDTMWPAQQKAWEEQAQGMADQQAMIDDMTKQMMAAPPPGSPPPPPPAPPPPPPPSPAQNQGHRITPEEAAAYPSYNPSPYLPPGASITSVPPTSQQAANAVAQALGTTANPTSDAGWNQAAQALGLNVNPYSDIGQAAIVAAVAARGGY